MVVLNGTELALKIKENLKKNIFKNYLSKNKKPPKLCVVLVGDNEASKAYVAGKVKACSLVGIESQVVSLPKTIKQKELENIIKKLNSDKMIDGILIQLPIPDHLNSSIVVNLISPEKDVDGLTNTNLGKLVSKDDSGLFGCTPSGVIKILKEYDIELEGKDVVIINRSLLVGKPLAFMFLNENATVTICHSKTQNLKEKILKADIVVIAIGKKHFLKNDMIKENAVVVDVGLVRDEKTNKLCGDVDFENVKQKSSFITPMPGGVGPMTIAMLLENTYLARQAKDNKKSNIKIEKRKI